MDELLTTTQRQFTAAPISKYFFQNTTFRDVKYSTPTVTSDDQLEIKFQVFAYDVLQGLFNYTIHFQKRPEHPPLFTVTLSNIYPLANHIVSQFTRFLPDPDLLTPSPTPTNEIRSAFRQTNLSSRGFLSTYAVGPRGKRAVWVERIRGSTVREVQVWSDPGTSDGQDLADGPPGEIERVAIHALTSPDLRGIHATLLIAYGFDSLFALQRILCVAP